MSGQGQHGAGQLVMHTVYVTVHTMTPCPCHKQITGLP